MPRFPLSIDLTEQPVLLIGHGPMAEEKFKKLQPFGADIRRLDRLTAEHLLPRPALVIVADGSPEEKERSSALCREHHIPVNVVDAPALCTFFFPALTTRGDVTISVSTDGKSPAAAAILRKTIEETLPENLEEILTWTQTLRGQLPRETLRQAIAQAFTQNRPLTEEEIAALYRP